MNRFTFKDKETYNGKFNTGKVVHQIETEIRIDNEDNSEMRITMTTCGQESPGGYGRHYGKMKAEVTCKKCLKAINKTK